jgi:hypothetical protein
MDGWDWSSDAVRTETLPGSDSPAHYFLAETLDGLYVPYALRLPDGEGPHPFVFVAYGNGGGGFEWLHDRVHRFRHITDVLLDAGYACAWSRYRTEVELGVFGSVDPIEQGWPSCHVACRRARWRSKSHRRGSPLVACGCSRADTRRFVLVVVVEHHRDRSENLSDPLPDSQVRASASRGLTGPPQAFRVSGELPGDNAVRRRRA